MSDELSAAIEGAQAYEDLHVNALFRAWADPVLDAGGVGEGDRVLDVACGTGIVARTALARVGGAGAVTGLDMGPGMLAVAERIEPRVTWVEGQAGELPFDAEEFDAVVSQFGLMFFPDRAQAVREMLRCVRPGRRIAVAVWDGLDRQAAFPVSVDLLQRRAGDAAADALRIPFSAGEVADLSTLFESAGASSASIETVAGTARFPSVRSMVEADLRGWLPIMDVHLDEDLIQSILAEADEVLDGYVDESGEMVFPVSAHIVTAPP